MHSHTEHINPLTPSVLLVDTQDTSSSLNSNNSYYTPQITHLQIVRNLKYGV